MSKIKRFFKYFTLTETIIWFSSVTAIVVSFFLFGGKNILTLVASIIGATSLIFNAKGNSIGQALMIVFSVIYGIISWGFAYYGEVATYLGMTMPMAIVALICWLKNPYAKGKSEVKVNSIKAREILFMFVLSAVITFGFYFILEYFDTANIMPSTISVTTSFIAVYLTFRRSPYFALAYAANDVVLIILWGMASKSDISYLSVVICFSIFLINDFYGFVRWQKMKRRQAENDYKY